jgi:hypothetical protein
VIVLIDLYKFCLGCYVWAEFELGLKKMIGSNLVGHLFEKNDWA